MANECDKMNLDHLAYKSLLAKAERLATDPNYDWDDINDRFERHAINAALDIAALRSRLAEVEKERKQDAKAEAEIQGTVGKYMADVEALQSRVTVQEEGLRQIINLTVQQPDYAKKVCTIAANVLTPAAPKEAEHGTDM